MKLDEGDVIRVTGFVMLKDLDPGKYRVSRVYEFFGRTAYAFTKPLGKEVLARHYASSVDAWIRPKGHPDLNKIEFVI